MKIFTIIKYVAFSVLALGIGVCAGIGLNDVVHGTGTESEVCHAKGGAYVTAAHVEDYKLIITHVCIREIK